MLTEDLIEQKIKNSPLNEIKETVFLFFEIFRLGFSYFSIFFVFLQIFCVFGYFLFFC